MVVEGTVTYKGQPLKKGKITFHPIEGIQAPLAGGDIVDGKYRVDRLGVLPAGSHRIQIKAYDVPAGKRVNITEAMQYLPAKYNTQSELKITISPDSSTITQDFDLSD